MRLHLPPTTQKKATEEALRRHYQSGLNELRWKAITWTRLHWWLLGLRNFRGFWWSGQKSFESLKGKRQIRYEKSVSILQTEIGRIMSMDIRPAVLRPEGISMDGLADASLSQAILDYMIGNWDDSEIKMGLGYNLATHGTVGIHVNSPMGPSVSDRLLLELVSPWELGPLPATPAGPQDNCGVWRGRWVDIDWLREATRGYISKFPGWRELEAQQAPKGTRLLGPGNPSGGFAEDGYGGGELATFHSYLMTESSRRAKAGGVPEQPSKEGKYVHLKEFWLYGPQTGSVQRWSIMAGKRLLFDIDYSNQKEGGAPNFPVCPLHVARYLTLGSFYGRSLMDRICYFNKEIETSLGNLFQNLEDLDWFGMLLTPGDMGISLSTFKEARKNRFGTYNPDPTGPEYRPERIGPNNTGDLGARSISMTDQLLDGLTSQGQIYKGELPGGLESARGMGVLLETMNVSMAPVAESLATAMTGAYRAMLQVAPVVMPEDFPLKISRMDETILGLRVDPKQGTVSVDPRKIPDPWSVDITIRNKAPESKQQKLQLLKEELSAGNINRIEYLISVQREGLGVPILDKSYYESYKKAWWENIILFGDGQTPGQIDASQTGDIHPIHLMVIKQLTATIAFQQASEEVRSVVLQHQDFHESMIGPFPQDLLSLTQMGGLSDQPMDPRLQQELSSVG